MNRRDPVETDSHAQTLSPERARMLDYLRSRAAALGPAEIRALFPGCRFDLRRLTLPPPLARMLAPRSQTLVSLLSHVGFLKAFYLVAIHKLDPTPT